MSFETTEYLLFGKKKPELDSEILSGFNPFLVSKSFSFYKNGLFVDYVNETLNVYGNLFKSKEDQFRFFENIIPKQKKQRINYIKKEKIVSKEQLPIPEFYSAREIDLFKNYSKYEHE